MTNKNAVSAHRIEIGDRVLVDNATQVEGELHWGTVLEHSSFSPGIRVRMDNPELYRAKGFALNKGTKKECYLAYYEEVKQHIPASKVAMHEGRPVNVEDHAEPKPLTAHDDIQATLDFLHATTTRKWKATTKDVRLDVGGSTTYAGTMTIAFTEDKQS